MFQDTDGRLDELFPTSSQLPKKGEESKEIDGSEDFELGRMKIREPPFSFHETECFPKAVGRDGIGTEAAVGNDKVNRFIDR